MKNEKTRKTIKIILNVLLWAFVLFAVVITVLVFAAQNDENGVPSIGGKCIITIQSDSMKPTFEQGDMIIGQKLTDDEKKSLKPKSDDYEGDIITFPIEINGIPTFNTHRIIEVVRDESGNVTGYRTKGDNTQTNMVADTDTVRWEKVVSKYTGTRMAGLGRFLDFLKSSTGFLVVIVIPLVLFFVYELIRFVFALKTVKGKGAKQISAEDEEEIKRKAIEEFIKQQEAEKAAKEAGKAAEEVKDEVKETVEEKAEEVKETVEEKVEAVEEKAEEIKEVSGESVEEAKEAVEEKAEEVKEAVEEVKETAAETAEEVKETAAETVEEAKETVEEVKETAGEAVEEAAAEIKEAAEEKAEE
ncbi:signal peptidase I [bacterium]|nr:signal peptidase I [bacterium]